MSGTGGLGQELPQWHWLKYLSPGLTLFADERP